MKRSEKTGELVAFLSVNDEEDLVIINRSGIALRIRIADVPVLSRSTMGVRIINLNRRDDEIASACAVPTDPEEEAGEVTVSADEIEQAQTVNENDTEATDDTAEDTEVTDDATGDATGDAEDDSTDDSVE